MKQYQQFFGKLPLVLASGSPRRTELLYQIGLEHQVKVSNIEEHITEKEPCNIVMELAKQKARAVAKGESNGVIIGADTIVTIHNKILGKPKSEQEAFLMLQQLNGTTHSVFTGVHIVIKDGIILKEKSFFVESQVKMFSMTEEEIWDYIDTKEPMDKAGGYGIQGKAGIYIQEIHGDYYNIVGLPIGKLWEELKILGREYKR